MALSQKRATTTIRIDQALVTVASPNRRLAGSVLIYTFADAQVVLYLAYTRDLARNVFRLGLLRRGIDEATQRNHTLIRVHVDLEAADIWIGKQRRFHSCSYRRIIQILPGAAAMFAF